MPSFSGDTKIWLECLEATEHPIPFKAIGN